MNNEIPEVIREIIAGDVLTMGEAAKLLPAHRGEGTATVSSVWRWATTGAKASDGRIIRLETARFGGRNLTSRAALARFAAALSAAPKENEADAPSSQARSPSERQRAAKAAACRLVAAGA